MHKSLIVSVQKLLIAGSVVHAVIKMTCKFTTIPEIHLQKQQLTARQRPSWVVNMSKSATKNRLDSRRIVTIAG